MSGDVIRPDVVILPDGRRVDMRGRFDSDRFYEELLAKATAKVRREFGGVAQRTEQRSTEPRAAGSTPATVTDWIADAQWAAATVTDPRRYTRGVG